MRIAVLTPLPPTKTGVAHYSSMVVPALGAQAFSSLDGYRRADFDHVIYQLELEKRKEEQSKLEGEKKDIGFGSQIRSYVLQPYQLIKDVRTGFEVGDPQRVLDGDLDGLIEAYLSAQARKTAD